MLDTTTKQKIDSIRNLLVGKVPDPKSQVEQITVALFYKFMWDRDMEIKALGGNATFFVDEFEKYSWENLFAPDLGGSDCIKLYSEAIEAMENNPNIPSIFRDIFKRAYLPYNDFNTLRLFLKEINDFHYSNSEKLGDGFEYLLSILGTQGDAGQFRTPRHIIDFITEVVNPQKGDRIVDPACGTAGFIISAYKHILKTNTKESLGDLLTPEDKKRLGNNLVGLDIDPMMVKLALANMYLHGLNEPHIYEYDSLTSEERWDDMFDVVLANPPFMTPSGGIRPHKRFAVNALRSEVLFTSYINTHLSKVGKAGIVVPEGIIFEKKKAYVELKKQLIESSLIGVISLPSGVFKPYSPVKTSILILDKELNKKTDKIFFSNVRNDGFDLGSQRRKIDENDLPKISKSIIEYCNNLRIGITNDQKVLNFISKTDILNSDGVDLTYYNYQKQNILTKYETIDLLEIIKAKKPKLIKSLSIKGNGAYPVVDQSSNFISGFSDDEIKLNRVDEPIIIFGDHTRVFKYIDFDFVGSGDGTKMLSVSDKANTKFIYYILKGFPLRNLGYSRHFKLLKELKIPFPPLNIQKKIVVELDQFQKIIGGAKRVVCNYKPHFEIDSNWELIKLGKLTSLMTGGTPSTKDQENYKNGSIKWLVSGDIHKGIINDCKGRITEKGLNSSNTKYLPVGSVMIALNGQGKTRGTVAVLNTEAVCNQSLVSINSNDDTILDNRYLYYFLMSKYQQIRNITGDKDRRGLNMTLIRNINILLPEINIQKQIIQKIEEEIEIVDGNKKLIEIYTKKIEDRINKIWGE
jgi:type I restriction enzyme M protein